MIPVYNIKDYIEDCLKTVLNQDLANSEIVLVNDGSTDGSQDICEEYSEKYDHIKLIDKPNGGLSDARNHGIVHASGEYILFVDGDDLIAENILGSLAKFTLAQGSPDLVLFDYTKFHQNQERLEPIERRIQPEMVSQKNGASLLAYLLEDDPHFHWFVWQGLYRKELLLDYDLFFQEGRLYEDALWTPDVLLHARSAAYFKESIYIYRLEREGQITSTIDQKSLRDNIYIPVYWSKRLEEVEIGASVKNLLMGSFVIRYYYAIWFLHFISPSERLEIIELLKEHDFLLKYSKSPLQKTTRLLVKTTGINAAAALFKSAISVKRKWTDPDKRRLANER